MVLGEHRGGAGPRLRPSVCRDCVQWTGRERQGQPGMGANRRLLPVSGRHRASASHWAGIARS